MILVRQKSTLYGAGSYSTFTKSCLSVVLSVINGNLTSERYLELLQQQVLAARKQMFPIGTIRQSRFLPPHFVRQVH
jgi:hypothetical protein